jgi:hydroxymethylpyrimidine pyrophosphatase-like HAD family hydrolase
MQIVSEYPQLTLDISSGEDWYQFLHIGVNKWPAVQQIAERFGISADDIVAFGDDHNDIEMLKGAGTSVAVENAIDAVKTVTFYICNQTIMMALQNGLKKKYFSPKYLNGKLLNYIDLSGYKNYNMI